LFVHQEEIMFRKQVSVFILAAFVGAGAIGCNEDGGVSGPDSTRPAATLDPAKKIDDSGNTIADIAVDFATAPNPEFTILVAALQAADLVDALKTKGQTTVFAPTDAAFQKLFANPDFPFTPDQLLAPENREVLTAVLLYHLVPGKRLSGDVLESEQIRMRSGQFTFPMLDGGNAYLRDGSSITPDARLLAQEGLIDVLASNGVIHVIDEVLLP
jgi:uncharacterized surface protein with fasciclin (FAS1) repeats